MTPLRIHRLPLAWLLLACILFNGMACSVGHGRLLGALGFGAGHPAMHMDGHHDGMHMDMPMPAEPHHLDLSAMLGDCAFAGVMAVPLSFLLALGWLLRAGRPTRVRPEGCRGSPPRAWLPTLNPQAP